MFVRIEYKSYNGTSEGYVSEGYDDAVNVMQMGDLVVITRTVDGKTEEVMVPARNVIRIETEHDHDLVTEAQEELERREQEILRMRRNEHFANNLVIPTAV